MIAVTWPTCFLLLCITLYSTICAADPLDDTGNPNVNVTYDNKDTTISMFENNEANIKIAIVNYDTIPVITFEEGNEALLGLTILQEGDVLYLVVENVQDFEREDMRSYTAVLQMDTYEFVHINVVNEDDEKPYFNMESSSCTVEETDTGYTDCKLTVIDVDGFLENMEYTVLESGVVSEELELVTALTETCTETGTCIDVVLYIKEPLDFLSKPVYSLRLQAKDQGGNEGASVSYIVQVNAVNKNIPVISPDKLETTVPEHYSGVLPDISPIVTDRDSASYGQFKIELHDVSAGVCFDAFAVVPSGGYLTQEIKISVNNPLLLDYENENCRTLNFKIVATEMDNDTRFGTADVTVIVTDINDSSPEFDRAEYSFEIPEREPIGSYLGTIIATDADEGNAITYAMSSTMYTNINSSGDIVSTVVYNYEIQSEIIVTARAMDQDNNIGYAQVVVKVLNVNDERPVLQMPSTQPRINEDVVPPTNVEVVIIATDPDLEAAVLTIDIDWPNSRATKQGAPVDNSLFDNCMEIAITNDDTANVSATLTLLQKLNWGEFDTLYLTIVAEDTNTSEAHEEQRSTSAILTIYVDDVNDNEPVFGDPGNITVAEGTDTGKLIGFITATDADGPGNNEIEFSMTCEPSDKEYVTINPQTGGIYTTDNEIDFETFEQLSCSVTATDQVFKPVLNIIIYVLDENDNWPIFEENTADEYYVDEHENDEYLFGYITATDADTSPPYKTIYYKSSSQFYTIDSVSGRFYLLGGYEDDLDYENEKLREIDVTITASDNCEDGNCKAGSKSTTKVVTVYLNNINDHPPVLPALDIYEVSEETKENENVFPTIQATDPDGGGVDFEIPGFTCNSGNPSKNCSDLFEIEKTGVNAANIKAKKALTDCWGVFDITVKATDNGTISYPNNSSSSKIYTVSIYDMNNNLPEFITPEDGASIHLYMENLHVGEDITNANGEKVYIEAKDENDRGVNGTTGITYEIKDETASEYFQPDGTGGKATIKLIKSITTVTNFQLKISAKDGVGDTVMESTVTATILIHLNGSYPPVFDYPDWKVSFAENTTGQTQSYILMPAIDPNNEEDPIIWEEIYYFITEDTPETQKFNLDKSSGQLKLQEGMMLDYEEADTLNFTIAATNEADGSDIDKLVDNSIILVIVTVTDVIDTAPVFETGKVYSQGIKLTQQASATPLFTITATDEEAGDKLKYEILDGIVTPSDSSLDSIKEPFELNVDTGELIQNFNADESLKGYFDFTVRATDLADLWGDAPVRMYMIANENLISFTFGNPRTDVNNMQSGIANILTDIIKYECHVEDVVIGESDDLTNVQTYFLNTNENTPVHKDVISIMVNVQETFNTLRGRFSELGLNLKTVELNAATTETDMESVLQTILIVVSVVLGTLVIVLFAAFFFRTRSLNRRLEALSTTKFGSQDSGLNRIGGMTVPNTNKHILEGSNPIWGNEKIGSHEYDNASVSSGDSDLIGVEENPEFNQTGKSGTANVGYTPDNPAPRRPTGHPMMDPNFGQNAPASLADLQASTIGRRESVNPMSGTNIGYNYGGDDDSDAGSAREILSNVHNSNFSFMPTTEL